jgi:hypothetical protein
VIEFGRARCAEHVTALADGARRRLRKLIVDHQEAAMLNPAAGGSDLQTKLVDAFGTMNRDWRRLAVTEATENLNQGFIASCRPGEKVRRVEKYRGACPFCRQIDGTVMTVVAPDAPRKDGETQIWVGKTNVGRSASPRRRRRRPDPPRNRGDVVDRGGGHAPALPRRLGQGRRWRQRGSGIRGLARAVQGEAGMIAGNASGNVMIENRQREMAVYDLLPQPIRLALRDTCIPYTATDIGRQIVDGVPPDMLLAAVRRDDARIRDEQRRKLRRLP